MATQVRSPDTDRAVIPGSLTSVVQPHDVCLNKPFKDTMKDQWSNWMIEGEKRPLQKGGGGMQTPTLETVRE